MSEPEPPSADDEDVEIPADSLMTAKNITILVMVAALIGQFYFLMIFSSTEHVPDGGDVVSLDLMTTRICGLVISVSVFLATVMILVGMSIKDVLVKNPVPAEPEPEKPSN